MILDSSAVVTVLRREEGYRRYASTLEEATDPAIGAPTLLETEIVAIRRFGPTWRERVARFLDHYGIAVIPFDNSHRYAATDAFSATARAATLPDSTSGTA